VGALLHVGRLGGKLEAHLLPELTEIWRQLLQARALSYPIGNDHASRGIHSHSVDIREAIRRAVAGARCLPEIARRRYRSAICSYRVPADLSGPIRNAKRCALDGKRPNFLQVRNRG